MECHSQKYTKSHKDREAGSIIPHYNPKHYTHKDAPNQPKNQGAVFIQECFYFRDFDFGNDGFHNITLKISNSLQ